ncbi:MAG: ATP-binding protein [Bacteroidales bacterium]|nr:ATP-binding protein [Bacteroidales bacterium]
MIRRDLYLNQLCGFIDKPYIKVITGIRRSGKSAILQLLKDELLKRGIGEENIIHINFESFEYTDVDNSDKLYYFIKAKITNNQRYYILLDEIQEVLSWEKAVDAFLVDINADLFITGSNSRLLSSELATYLAGRYVEIHIHTLSFAEYLLFKQTRTHKEDKDIYREFGYFLRLGGFPVLHTAEYTLETAYKVVFDIYSSAILRDTVQRFNIRDVELLERVVKYVFDNVGNKFSAKNVADYFKSQHRKIDLNTVYNYLNALEGAFIVYKIPRYDVKGREILKTFEKYYVGDQALLYALMGYKDRLISGVLENIVMLELQRRGYRVFVGKSDDKEIDFIAELKERKVYIQVAYKMTEQTTIDREFTPLLEIKDHHPKYVVTMDETWKDNIEGVQHKHIADFLLMNEY